MSTDIRTQAESWMVSDPSYSPIVAQEKPPEPLADDPGWHAVADGLPPEGANVIVYAPPDHVSRQPRLLTFAVWGAVTGWWPIPSKRAEGITHWRMGPGEPVIS